MINNRVPTFTGEGPTANVAPRKSLLDGRREGWAVQLRDLQRMRLQAEELAAEDKTRLEAATQRVQAAALELAAAQAEKDLVAGMASSSGALLATIDKRIEQRRSGNGTTQAADRVAAREAGNEGEAGTRVTVADAIRALLRAQGEATTKEITKHIRRVRPDVNVKNTNPELTRLVKRGDLVRPCAGVYRLSTRTSDIPGSR
ncbi:hypothetical protein [Streptomyces sp. NPDC002619]|uniref:hypothetical protein n=1 Tax=Streptomyces sp. NPDC002619 TaxID=3364655 RepID=UPI00368C5DA0